MVCGMAWRGVVYGIIWYGMYVCKHTCFEGGHEFHFAAHLTMR